MLLISAFFYGDSTVCWCCDSIKFNSSRERSQHEYYIFLIVSRSVARVGVISLPATKLTKFNSNKIYVSLFSPIYSPLLTVHRHEWIWNSFLSLRHKILSQNIYFFSDFNHFYIHWLSLSLFSLLFCAISSMLLGRVSHFNSVYFLFLHLTQLHFNSFQLTPWSMRSFTLCTFCCCFRTAAQWRNHGEVFWDVPEIAQNLE